MDFTLEKKVYLDSLVARYEQSFFIEADPISIPHAYSDPRDQEIIGLFSATLAWGQRVTILRKMEELSARMNYHPHDFVISLDNYTAVEHLSGFKHRTFRGDDVIWFALSLRAILLKFGTIENAFLSFLKEDSRDTGPAIQGFSDLMLTIVPDVPSRMAKHLARPSTGSACKRLNMYLRWMVRPGPVDLGIWKGIDKTKLLLPLDVHSGKNARSLGLLNRPTNNWAAACELTSNCRVLCPDDPCRYDFAFFGSGAYNLTLDPRFTVERGDSTSTPTDT